eukprot:15126135-Alexandrium_andersonii.AAC.1
MQALRAADDPSKLPPIVVLANQCKALQSSVDALKRIAGLFPNMSTDSVKDLEGGVKWFSERLPLLQAVRDVRALPAELPSDIGGMKKVASAVAALTVALESAASLSSLASGAGV